MQIWVWVGFLVLVGVVMVFDLIVLTRGEKTMSPRKALVVTAALVVLSLAFAAFVYWMFDTKAFGMGLVERGGKPMTGARATGEFITGYVLEYSLSVDNLFVFALVFGHFRVPAAYQHRVLLWGIVGALVMRGIMILVGSAALAAVSWLIYLFAAFLIITALRMLFSKHDQEVDLERKLAVRMARRLFPVSPDYDGQHFFTRLPSGVRAATPLFLVLLTIEFTDVVFAVDSIPAIFGVTSEPFIVFSSNVLAIMGLRSLYFALAGVMHLRFLKTALAVVLLLVGIKMVLGKWVEVPEWAALAGVVSVLGVGVGASLLWPGQTTPEAHPAQGAPKDA